MDFQGLIDSITVWVNEAHGAIMWISGITGISSGMIILILLTMGSDIAKGLLSLLGTLIVIAAIFFFVSWYVGSGYPLPSLSDIPSIDQFNVVTG